MPHPKLLASRWRAFWPPPQGIDLRERVRVACGVAFGLLLAGGLVRWLGGSAGPWLVAPLGASAVLVFGLPASPLAQPWPVIGGNTLSALVGIACAQLVPWPAAAAALAGGLAVGLMLMLRCLHPPGGAASLLGVVGGIGDWRFALVPVMLNSLLLVAAGIAYNHASGRRYPHPQAPAAPEPALHDAPERFTDADLDAALAQYNQLLDLPRDDLRGLLEQAEAQAQQRRLSRLRCSDIMTPDPAVVLADTPTPQAWALLQARQVRALPVVDQARQLVGIVTVADFARAAEPSAAQRVGQIMTRRVRIVSAERTLAELLPLMSSTGHHHIPVIGAQARLLGMVTQSDVIAALMREGGHGAG